MIEIVRSIRYIFVNALSIYSWKLLSLVLAILLCMCIGSTEELGATLADTFCGYEQCRGSTTKVPLKSSPVCKEGQDYIVTPASVNPSNAASDVTVVSIHGGKIEPDTSTISSHLSTRYQWNRYDFYADIDNKECLALTQGSASDSANDNFTVLHITSDHFDDSRAVDLVKGRKVVSIHGHGRTELDNKIQLICVGGKNKDQRVKFINYVNKKQSNELQRLLGYSLNPVNVPKPTASDSESDCIKKRPRLNGTNADNIVNRNGPNGGLQLELSRKIRLDLGEGNDTPNAPSPDKNQRLRNVIYEAINCAIGGNC